MVGLRPIVHTNVHHPIIHYVDAVGGWSHSVRGPNDLGRTKGESGVATEALYTLGGRCLPPLAILYTGLHVWKDTRWLMSAAIIYSVDVCPTSQLDKVTIFYIIPIPFPLHALSFVLSE